MQKRFQNDVARHHAFLPTPVRVGSKVGSRPQIVEADERIENNALTITDPIIVAATTLFDAAMIAGGSAAAWFVYHIASGIELPDWHIYVMASLLLALIFLLRGLDGAVYNDLLSGDQQRAMYRTAGNFIQSFMLFVTFLVMSHWATTYSRGSLVLQFLICWIAIMLARSIELRVLRHTRIRNYVVASKVFLVGSPADVRRTKKIWRGENAHIFISGSFLFTPSDYPPAEVFDRLASLVDQIVLAGRGLKPDRIIILLPCQHSAEIGFLVDHLAALPCNILVSTETLSVTQSRPEATAIGGMHMLRLVRKPLTTRDRILKRGVDFSVSILLLLVLCPLLAFVAIAIKVDSRGSVLFVQKRRGFNQRQFSIYKFRTMRSEQGSGVFRQTQQGDQRITTVGKFLRRWNIDELPQLINVLRGEMSLVGPRPHALQHDDMYYEDIADYARRHNIKPGITGLAQINGCRGATETLAQMEDRVRFDLEYIQHWTFLLDFKIMVMTAFSPKSYVNAY